MKRYINLRLWPVLLALAIFTAGCDSKAREDFKDHEWFVDESGQYPPDAVIYNSTIQLDDRPALYFTYWIETTPTAVPDSNRGTVVKQVKGTLENITDEVIDSAKVGLGLFTTIKQTFVESTCRRTPE